MKSQMNMLLSVATALLYDAQSACAYQESELEKDLSSLQFWSTTRGLGLFTLDLPSLDNCLLSSLEAGRLSTSGPLSRRRSKVDRRPRFLWALWSLVFDSSGCLIDGACPTAIFFLRSLFCLGKRIEVACSSERFNDALETYHEIEQSIVAPQLDWDADDLGPRNRDLSFINSFGPCLDRSFFGNPELELPLQRELKDSLSSLDFVSRVLATSLGTFNPISGEQGPREGRFRHGPGAVADANSTHFKYVFKHWPKKLEATFPYDWCGSHTIHTGEELPSVLEPSSKLIAVPKTAKTPRLIASEPAAHQWCQQKVASWLSDKFESTFIKRFITLRDQTKSQDLVAYASSTGLLATLDLSSASDRLSCRHVESLLSANPLFLEAVHAVRTRWIRDPLGDHVRFLRLKKFSAQGSALTFPIQSLFFLACCFAACGAKSYSDIDRLGGKVRVYGDDLIVPVDAYARLVNLLTYLGLKVNTQKSFSKGGFRESCGMDCYRGYDVTPAKPKTLIADTPERCQALIDIINNFWKKGCWNASKVLEATLTERKFFLPVIGPYSGVPALFSFCGTDFSRLQRRWNPHLQIEEVRMHRLMKPMKRERQDVSATLLQYFTEDPDPMLPWKSGVARERVAKFAPRWVDIQEFSTLNCVPAV